MVKEEYTREIAEILREELADELRPTKLGDDFIEKAKEYFLKIKRKIKELEGIKNPVIEREVKRLEEELKSVREMIEKIFLKRFRKGVYLALLASERNPKMLSTRNFLKIEAELFRKIAQELYDTRNKIISEITSAPEEEGIKVRILDDIPQFVWLDGKKYGPFSREDIVKLPGDIVEILEKRGKAEVIR